MYEGAICHVAMIKQYEQVLRIANCTSGPTYKASVRHHRATLRCVLINTVMIGRDEASRESLHTSVEEADETGWSQRRRSARDQAGHF